VKRLGLRVTTIVVTHAHIDHIGGAQKLKRATGAAVLMNENDLPLYDQLDMAGSVWLGIPTPGARRDRYAGAERRSAVGGSSGIRRARHSGPHSGRSALWIPAEKKLLTQLSWSGRDFSPDCNGILAERGKELLAPGAWDVKAGQPPIPVGEHRSCWLRQDATILSALSAPIPAHSVRRSGELSRMLMIATPNFDIKAAAVFFADALDVMLQVLLNAPDGIGNDSYRLLGFKRRPVLRIVRPSCRGTRTDHPDPSRGMNCI